jgi:hypothetical protein
MFPMRSTRTPQNWTNALPSCLTSLTAARKTRHENSQRTSLTTYQLWNMTTLDWSRRSIFHPLLLTCRGKCQVPSTPHSTVSTATQHLPTWTKDVQVGAGWETTGWKHITLPTHLTQKGTTNKKFKCVPTGLLFWGFWLTMHRFTLNKHLHSACQNRGQETDRTFQFRNTC